MNKYFNIKNYQKKIQKHLYSPIASSLEGMVLRSFLESRENQEIKDPPIFILGLPRSGTTFVYQLVSHLFSCLYIDNFIEKFSSTPILSFWLRNVLWGNNGHGSFSSNYGDTTHDGLLAPNQGVNFWYHWLPNMNHSHDIHDLSPKSFQNIQGTISYLTNRYKKPFLFKELSLSQKLPILNKMFPESKMIIVETDLTVNSIRILNAMSANGVNKGAMWGGFFKGYKNFVHLEKERMVAHQVVYLKHYMDCGLALFPEKQILRVNFDDLYTDFNLIVRNVDSFLGRMLDNSIDQRVLQDKKIYDKKVILKMSNYIEEAKKNLLHGWNLE